VIGNDAGIGFAAHSGQLQLNAYEPLAGVSVMESQQLSAKLGRRACGEDGVDPVSPL
jgi:aspartate ammonia-lyase